ncbi:lariat debranching enzyme, C-terminal domain-containing protein [Podospora australis]|uniref:Lariat debranching enzyme, C-terminal domain-containing protein n=1 Tax=Podospora australis TaxID=1536484 RepID=A0AAN6WIK7_9PEZI|nr:lariat debranching enzyme, C-terminal domain-containing protein [Podospora australis]
MLSSSAASTVAGQGLKIAVVGCGHGELDTIYATAEAECEKKGWTLSQLDFLIICGDFQAVRNELDLNGMSVPQRYRKLGDFHKYYSGEAKAPVLTIVIGGNHEAANYLFELYHGGWLAPNVYYLGAAGVVRYGPCRIAGISGIYNSRDYTKPHGERLPYDRDDIRSVYHVREYDVQRLLQLRKPIDIALSHDWPAWIELFGDYRDLYAKKPHFLASAVADNLGSKPGTGLFDHLRPSYWFSGHMHVRFSAVVDLQGQVGIDNALAGMPDLPDKLKPILTRSLSKGKGSKNVSPRRAVDVAASKTEFLALSKVGSPTSEWLEVRSLTNPPLDHMDNTSTTVASPPDNERTSERKQKFELCYDEEWLAITRAYAPELRIANPETLIVPPATATTKVSKTSLDEHKRWTRENITDKGLLQIPRNFARHAPVFERSNPGEAVTDMQPVEYPNQQTSQFCELLQIENTFAIPDIRRNNDAETMVEFASESDCWGSTL